MRARARKPQAVRRRPSAIPDWVIRALAGGFVLAAIASGILVFTTVRGLASAWTGTGINPFQSSGGSGAGAEGTQAVPTPIAEVGASGAGVERQRPGDRAADGPRLPRLAGRRGSAAHQLDDAGDDRSGGAHGRHAIDPARPVGRYPRLRAQPHQHSLRPGRVVQGAGRRPRAGHAHGREPAGRAGPVLRRDRFLRLRAHRG